MSDDSPGLGEQYENVAINRYTQEGADALRQYALRKLLEREAGTLRAAFPTAAKAAGRAVPVVNAGLTGYAAGTAAYNMMPREAQDAIGGTINSVARSMGGGVDDMQYLARRSQPKEPAVNTMMLPSQPVTTFAGGLKRKQPQGYTGTLSQQYEQALGTPTRYVSPDVGTQRLNAMYDDALGYSSAGMPRRAMPAAQAPQTADTYMPTPRQAPPRTEPDFNNGAARRPPMRIV